jgi:hypothetical protein
MHAIYGECQAYVTKKGFYKIDFSSYAYQITKSKRRVLRKELKYLEKKILNQRPGVNWRHVLKNELLAQKARDLKKYLKGTLHKGVRNFTSFDVAAVERRLTTNDNDLRPLISNLLRKPIDGHGNTIFHLILQVTSYGHCFADYSTTDLIDWVTFYVESSRLGEHTCLTVVNHKGQSPLHLLVEKEMWDVLYHIVQFYRKEIAIASFNNHNDTTSTPRKTKHAKLVPQFDDVPILGADRYGISSGRYNFTKYQYGTALKQGKYKTLYTHEYFKRYPKPLHLLHALIERRAPLSLIELLDDRKIFDIKSIVNTRCVQSGNTAIHYAIYEYVYTNTVEDAEQALQTIVYLVEHGASMRARNDDGFTPMALFVYLFELRRLQPYTFKDLGGLLIAAGRKEGINVLSDTVSYALHDDLDVSVFEVCLLRWKYEVGMFQWFVQNGVDLLRASAHTGKTALFRILDYQNIVSLNSKFLFLVQNGGAIYTKMINGVGSLHYLCEALGAYSTSKYGICDTLELYFQCNRYNVQDVDGTGQKPTDYLAKNTSTQYDIIETIKKWIRKYSK